MKKIMILVFITFLTGFLAACGSKATDILSESGFTAQRPKVTDTSSESGLMLKGLKQ